MLPPELVPPFDETREGFLGDSLLATRRFLPPLDPVLLQKRLLVFVCQVDCGDRRLGQDFGSEQAATRQEGLGEQNLLLLKASASERANCLRNCQHQQAVQQ